MISVDSSLSWLAADVRVYFPEWADRPAERGTLLESEYNSYLAGGYAEEFGHHTQWSGTATAVTLTGDPEGTGQWRVQIEGLHPGYPECPRPLDRFVMRSAELEAARAPSPAIAARQTASPRLAVKFAVIRVGERGRVAQSHVALPSTLALRWKEFRIRRRALGGLF